jgi:hypothetical protein
VDADDILEPTLLDKSVDVLAADPSVAFVSHWLRAFGDETWDWTPASCDLPSLLDMNAVNGAALVRRTAFEAVGGFDETMRDGCEDWDFWISLVERGYTGRILPEFLFRYRRRAESMSRVMHGEDRHPLLYRRLIEKHASSFELHMKGLLLRRERDIAHFNRQIEDLELERGRWLLPEVDTLRDDVSSLERRVERLDRWRSLTDERDCFQQALLRSDADRDRLVRVLEASREEVHGLEQAVTGSRNETLRLQQSLAESRDAAAAARQQRAREVENQARAYESAVAEAHELGARAHRAEEEVVALRQSLSWRLTAPARLVWSAVRRIGKNRS